MKPETNKNMNKQNLHLLILEDNPDDAELIIRELKKEGFVLEWKRVETEKTFRKALAEKPDIILSDYNLPSFSGMTAIKIHQALTPEIPLIIVSDMMSGDLAVECIKAGATDYVHKKQLSRLNPVVNRALNEVEAYSERKKAQEELQRHRDHLQELVKERTSELSKSEEKYRQLAETAKDVIMVIDLKGNVKYINHEGINLCGYSKEEIFKMNVNQVLPADKIPVSDNNFARRIAGDKSLLMYEIDFVNKKGDKIPVEIKSSLITEHGKPSGVLIIARDITERKQAEEKEKEYYNNIQILSKTAMTFVDFPADKNIYNFIGEQLRELIGKDSYIVINTIDKEKSILTTRAVLGIGKFTDKIARLLGRHPVGMTFDAKDEELVCLSDGKLHLNEEGLYVIFLKTVPKVVCNSIEKLLNIKKIYGIGLTKENKLFGTVVLFLKEKASEIKNRQTIETFIKQASIAVQKRQAEEINLRLAKIIRNATDGIILTNPEGQIHYINPAFEKMSGYTQDELLNTDPANLIVTDDITAIAKKIRSEVKTKGEWKGDLFCMRKNGEIYPIGTRVFAINNTKGELEEIAAIQQDIAERKQAEEALRESEEKFRSITGTAQDAIVMIDNSGNISYWNKSAKNIFGYTEKEVIGRELHKLLVHKKYYRDYLKGFDKFKETGKGPAINKTLEFSGIKKDKTEFPLELSLSSVKLKGKWNAIAIIRDITERRKAQDELKNYANTQKVLLQEVNHRVKNNLTAILGLLQIEEAKIKNKAYSSFINEFKGRIYGLSTVHSLLAKNNWQPLNLNLLCDKIINASIDCLHCSNITDINISPSTVLISSNQAYHLTLVINELITNSLKYGQNNKHKILINVDIKKNKENIIITYRDTGKGYPKELTERNFSNTGVGFDLIKGIVTHSLNGKLQIYNDNGAVTVLKFKHET